MRLQTDIAICTDDGFVSPSPAQASDPSCRVYLKITIDKNKFVKLGSFDYYKGAEAMWISAMQKWVANQVYLIRDPESPLSIFIFFPFQNDPHCTVWLGKLHESCELYPIAQKAFDGFRMEG